MIHGSEDVPYFSQDHMTYTHPGLRVDPKPSDFLSNVSFVTLAELGGFVSVEI